MGERETITVGSIWQDRTVKWRKVVVRAVYPGAVVAETIALSEAQITGPSRVKRDRWHDNFRLVPHA
jgi:hypothetical protein